MIVLNKNSRDFLKLLFCYDYIRLLKVMLKSNEEQTTQLNKDNAKLVSDYNSMVKASRDFKTEMRKTTYVQNLLTLNKSLKDKNRKLRQTNNDLVGEIVILRNKLDYYEDKK